MLIFVPNINERWIYTLDFIFRLRGIEYNITDSKEEFDKSDSSKFSFSTWNLGSVLNENKTTKQTISKENWKDVECLGFDKIADPLSSIFYVLSRMEEYAETKVDKHGRFEGESSLQYKYGWLEQCVCDRWAQAIVTQIEKEINSTLNYQLQKGEIIPTFDIDNTYAYSLKKGSRKYLSIIKDLLSLNLRRLKERGAVLKGKLADPYDTYEIIEKIADHFPIRLFWLAGDYGSFDNNISLKVTEHQEILKKMNEKAIVGIHPSYSSNSDFDLLETEVSILSKIVGSEIKNSRQHFLKLTLPLTYHTLIKVGIKEDFTMGFADRVGFRNGTAHAFPWFDLSENKVSSLLVRPFAYMDGTLNEYLHLTPREACLKIELLFKEVSKYGGDFVFLWHNETIGEYGKWKGWRKVLDYTLTLQSEHKP